MNFMFFSLLTSINFLAVLVCAIVYFFLGSLWFSKLFGNLWVKELEKHNIIIKEPTPASLRLKMGLTFLGNIIASLGMAMLVHATASTTLCSGLELGILVALCFVMTGIGISYVWIDKSPKLFLIDAGYPALGVIIVAIILSLWR